MHEGPTIRIGLVAEIAEYEVTIVGDVVTVSYRDEERAGGLVTTQEVQHLARFVQRARELRVALAQFPNFEVVYLFDLAQDGYGYAVNLQVPRFSEWGYAPVQTFSDRHHDEVDDQVDRRPMRRRGWFIPSPSYPSGSWQLAQTPNSTKWSVSTWKPCCWAT